jgi:hypothetical protein
MDEIDRICNFNNVTVFFRSGLGDDHPAGLFSFSVFSQLLSHPIYV